MTAQEASPSESGAIIELSKVIVRGRNLLNGAEIYVGPVSAWFVQVRMLLRKIYGPESEAERQWPKIVDLNKISRDDARDLLRANLDKAEHLVAALNEAAMNVLLEPKGHRVFIGHGRSPVWRELKDFLHERLHLTWEEFNRESAPGLTTTERLQHMLDVSTFAFLIMTAEDEHADETFHARANVVHEAGLFQGRLGPRRAIILLEKGCQEFSNIHGLTHIPFPAGHIGAVFEEIRRVLEREGLIGT